MTSSVAEIEDVDEEERTREIDTLLDEEEDVEETSSFDI